MRRTALKELSKLRDIDPPEAAIDALEDPDASVRLAAAKYFERQYDKRAESILIKSLDDSDDLVAEQAAESLCEMSTTEALDAVQQYYRTGTNPRTAYECGKELKKSGWNDPLPGGLQRFRELLHDGDPQRRKLAVTALGRLGTRDEAPLIEARLQDDAAAVRGRAEEVLAAWRE